MIDLLKRTGKIVVTGHPKVCDGVYESAQWTKGVLDKETSYLIINPKIQAGKIWTPTSVGIYLEDAKKEDKGIWIWEDFVLPATGLHEVLYGV